jgi:hypothetical protein
MCIFCPKFITNEQILSQLKDTLIKPCFEEWNTISIRFVLYSAFGLYGQECRSIALDIFKEFISYLYQQPIMYIPKNGVDPMYHPYIMNNMYQYASIFEPNYKLIEEQEQQQEVIYQNPYKYNILATIGIKMKEYEEAYLNSCNIVQKYLYNTRKKQTCFSQQDDYITSYTLSVIAVSALVGLYAIVSVFFYS